MDISIVIPTLNEEDFIERSIFSARGAGNCEIVVCDGGSQDRTLEIARDLCRTVAAGPGRAIQMNAGARSSSGGVLLFLHADTLLPLGAFNAIRHALEIPGCVGGCFRLRFDARSPLLDVYSAFTRLKMKSLCFGDRALFVRRAVFEDVGGFPTVPIFEDLEMVRRLSRRGRFAMLSQHVTTSARRFLAAGPGRQQLRNAYLWTRYHLGASPERLAHYYPYGNGAASP